jgi:serine/threonine protein kinase
MYQTVNTVPLSPSRINPDVPEMLDLILAKMLEKRPDNRYQSAADLASDLRECEKHHGSIPSTGLGPSAGLHELPLHLSTAADKTRVLVPQVGVHSRREDAGENEVEAGGLALSSVVESFSATQRLANEVGMSQVFNEYSATVRLARNESAPAAVETISPQAIATPPSRAIPLRSAASHPGPGVDGTAVIDRRAQLIAVAILVGALIAAGLIVFV